jgi:hypothetical protein
VSAPGPEARGFLHLGGATAWLPRRRAWVRDQSYDDGRAPWRSCQAGMASHTRLRVHLASVQPGWQRLRSITGQVWSVNGGMDM